MVKHLLARISFTATFATVACAMFLLAGCVVPVTSEPIYDVVEPATLAAGDSIPTPQGETILTVSGKIGTTNQDDLIVMDRETIESAGLVEYDVHDPFEDRPVLFRGVLMSDLLPLWQVADDATTARLTALNDYQIDVPISEFSAYPVLFALQADGAYMEVNYRGPAMLVYPLDDYNIDIASNKRRWIWQIKSIELQ